GQGVVRNKPDVKTKVLEGKGSSAAKAAHRIKGGLAAKKDPCRPNATTKSKSTISTANNESQKARAATTTKPTSNVLDQARAKPKKTVRVAPTSLELMELSAERALAQIQAGSIERFRHF